MPNEEAPPDNLDRMKHFEEDLRSLTKLHSERGTTVACLLIGLIMMIRELVTRLGSEMYVAPWLRSMASVIEAEDQEEVTRLARKLN